MCKCELLMSAKQGVMTKSSTNPLWLSTRGFLFGFSTFCLHKLRTGNLAPNPIVSSFAITITSDYYFQDIFNIFYKHCY